MATAYPRRPAPALVACELLRCPGATVRLPADMAARLELRGDVRVHRPPSIALAIDHRGRVVPIERR